MKYKENKELPSFTLGGMKGTYMSEAGRRVRHPEYSRWMNIKARCYYPTHETDKRNYAGCTMSEDWRNYRNFYEWLHDGENERRFLDGWQIDKDFLFVGNSEYSKEKCILVPKMLNGFVGASRTIRGDHPIGTFFCGQKLRIKAQVKNPIKKNNEHLGFFDCEMKAHLAWRKRKLELLGELRDNGYFEGVEQKERVFENCKTIIEQMR